MSLMNDEEVIAHSLERCHTIAVVGLSTNPGRDSYQVARYMQGKGYRIIPVNPVHADSVILGEYCHGTLEAAAAQLAQQNQLIDMVNCFRRSEFIIPIAQSAVAIGAQCLWMQLGIVNHDAAAIAQGAGLMVVMDRCLKIEYAYR